MASGPYSRYININNQTSRVFRDTGPAYFNTNDGILEIAQTVPAPCTVYTPPIVDITGKVYTLQDGAGNAATYPITLTPIDPTKTINGAATYTISTNFGSVDFYYTGETFLIKNVSTASTGPTTNPVSIAQGGTGATTLAGAQTALGIPALPITPANGGTGSSSPTTQATTIDNTTATQFPKWRAALARVKNNGGQARIAFVGDSTFYGIGSTGTIAAGQNYPPKAIPADFSGYLNTSGVNAHWNSFFGNQLGNPAGVAPDFRITGGTGWTNAGFSLGGTLWESPTGPNTNPLIFTPTTSVDTFKIYYANIENVVMALNINGGTNTLITGTGASNLISTTITGTLGINSLNIFNNSSNNNLFIVGVEAWDSSKSWISCANMGCGNSTSGNWNDSSSAWAPINAIPTVGADLWLLNLGINDAFGAVSIATYTANMQALITAMKSSGDCALVTFTPINGTPTQGTYIAAMFALAASNNIPIIDNNGRWVSYAVSQPLGYYADTIVHPSGAGYQDETQGIFKIIGDA